MNPLSEDSIKEEWSSSVPLVVHSLQRKQNLATGRITDNAGQLTASLNPRFDMNKTIFHTLKGPGALFQRTKLDVEYDWDPALAAEIEAAYASLPHAVRTSDHLFKFMFTECNFQIEHADGSFLDHLYFCHDYTAQHYPAASPRVMLLHSICGVGTNCFPMGVEKLPALASLLEPEEMLHVEAFPTVLRLLVHGPLLAQLMESPTEELQQLSAIKFHRLLDNELLELTADQLWTQLNFQLIHAIDFLPPASWRRTSGTYFFEIFVCLHGLLTRGGRLDANVGWDAEWMQPLVPGSEPGTWRHWLVDLLPTKVVLRLASKNMARLCAEVGHSLEYSLVWGGSWRGASELH